MPIVTIDDQPLDVEPGTLSIRAADRLAIEVPRFCYDPDVCPEGNCRMCGAESPIDRGNAYADGLRCCAVRVCSSATLVIADSSTLQT